MADETSRAFSAYGDVVAVEKDAPGVVRVVTWSDQYVVDVRHERCECDDMQHNLTGDGRCKHLHAARIATDQAPAPAPWPLTDDLSHGPEPLPDFENFEQGVEYV